MTAMRFCPSCGTARIEGARYCGGCGADFGAPGETPAVVHEAVQAVPTVPAVPADGRIAASAALSGRSRRRIPALAVVGILLVVVVAGAGAYLVLGRGQVTYAGTFSPTGSMTAGRAFTVATLLPDGDVLMTGGKSDFVWGPDGEASTFLATAEVFDPSTGTFSQAGSMASKRQGHSATVLSNGLVLVVGGMDGTASLSSAELYDPVSRTFRATGSMAAGRLAHTATLLPDGHVLICGGIVAEEGGAAVTAELYDPASGTFRATGSMATGRFVHGSARLLDGRVLVAGGIGKDSTTVASAELYDPASGTFSPTGSMTARRASPAVLLADGRVLMMGGEPTGDASATDSPTTAELYDPASGTFGPTGPLTMQRMSFTATVLADGRVLVAGGLDDTDQDDKYPALASAELYDPRTGTFRPTGSLGTARAMGTATLLRDGRVLIAGGLDSYDWNDPAGMPALWSAEVFR